MSRPLALRAQEAEAQRMEAVRDRRLSPTALATYLVVAAHGWVFYEEEGLLDYSPLSGLNEPPEETPAGGWAFFDEEGRKITGPVADFEGLHRAQRVAVDLDPDEEGWIHFAGGYAEIADFLGKSDRTINRVVSQLVRMGYIEAQHSARVDVAPLRARLHARAPGVLGAALREAYWRARFREEDEARRRDEAAQGLRRVHPERGAS